MRNYENEITTLRKKIGRPETGFAVTGYQLGRIGQQIREALKWDAENPEDAKIYHALVAEAEAEREIAEALVAERERIGRALRKMSDQLAASGVGELSNEAAKNPTPTEPLVFVQEWLPTEISCLVLCGGKGTGKSVAGTWAVREIIRGGGEGAFRKASELGRLSQFDAGAAELQKLKRAGLLVLDDLGAELLTDYAKAQFFELFDFRHENYRRTILTTNLPWAQLRERLGDRVVDRITQSGKVVQLAATVSMRKAGP